MGKANGSLEQPLPLLSGGLWLCPGFLTQSVPTQSIPASQLASQDKWVPT